MAARKKSMSVRDAIGAVQDAMRGTLKSGEMEELVKLALDILNTDYWDDVRGITADLIRQIKDGEITSTDELQERLHEAVDSSARVIYTFQARTGLLSTNNADTYEEEFGEKPESPEQAMFAALQEDVRAQLQAEDAEGMIEEKNG